MRSVAPRRPAVALVCALSVVLLPLLGAAGARAAEPLLPNIVGDPADNIGLETSTTEGGLKTSGEPQLLLRFNGYLHNVGPGAVDFRGFRNSTSEPMKAFQRIYYSDGTYKEEPSAAELIYVTADGHEHWHLQRAARYSLWNSAKSAEVAPAMKVGFCLDDSEHVEPGVGPSEAVYSDANGREFCRQHQPEALTLFEGISPGWRDTYVKTLALQWVDASEVLPGEYWLREDVNPTGVIKETGGANVPVYSTKTTIIPGFNALAESLTARPSQANTLPLISRAWNDTAAPLYKIVTPPQHGTLGTVTGSQVTYTPTSGYSGPDSFTYTAQDPNSPFPRHPSIATAAIEVTSASGGGEPALLAGDATSTYSVGDQTSVGREEAFAFTAKTSGTVEEMQFRTNGNANTGVSGVVLGVFSDNGGKPGSVLGQATVPGEPPTNSWIKAKGLSVPVVAGTKYWLLALPVGTSGKKLHYNAAVGSGGSGNVESVAGGLSALTAESSWETYNQGPVGFQAIGKTTSSQPSVTIEGAPASMTAGTSVQLTAHVSNDGPNVTWKASAGSITSGGLYTAPSEPPAGGSATITATTEKGATAQVSIEIKPAAQPSVAIEGAPASMVAGTSAQLTANVKNDGPNVTWRASAGTITSGGLYTSPSEPPAGGSATITATTEKGATAQVSIEILPAGSQTLLAGDATSTYSVGDQTSVGREEAFQFTARASGTVEEMQFRTNGSANTGVTGVVMGVLAENAGKPGAVLGQATAAGEPAANSWIKVGGLSIGLSSGSKYWLVVLPLGTSGKKLHYNAAAVSGGSGNVESVTGGLGALTAESSWETYNQGPVGFQAIGKQTGTVVIARVARSKPAREAHRRRIAGRRSRLAIAGLPGAVRAGTSVQLSALRIHDGWAVRWSANAGSVSASGLYTAPSRAGTAVVSASAGPAHERRTIEILPAREPRPAPAATLDSGSLARALAVRAVSAPAAVRAGVYLVLTSMPARAGLLTITASRSGHRLGGCTVRTPAARAVSCMLRVGTLAPGTPIAAAATLRSAGASVTSARAPAPVPPVED